MAFSLSALLEAMGVGLTHSNLYSGFVIRLPGSSRLAPRTWSPRGGSDGGRCSHFQVARSSLRRRPGAKIHFRARIAGRLTVFPLLLSIGFLPSSYPCPHLP